MVQIDKPSGKQLAKVLHYYNLLDGDSEFKIICPFHEDLNPSMIINLNEGNFYCFGCNLTGDAKTFVRYMNKDLNDLQALILYHKILKSDKVSSVKFKKHVTRKKENQQALVEAKDYYYGLKFNNWDESSDDEKDYLLKRGFNTYALNKCKAKINYNYSYPIIFPMLDMGEFKGWVCRTTNPVVEKKRKYLYNEGFSRRNTLVGRYDNHTVVVCEGYMDWLKLKMFGVKYACAFLGWKATNEQIQKLKSKGVKRIISALDNDKCGKQGTQYLKSLGMFEVVPFQFPEGVKDPGEMTVTTFKQAQIKTNKIIKKGGNNHGKNKRLEKRKGSKDHSDNRKPSDRRSNRAGV